MRSTSPVSCPIVHGICTWRSNSFLHPRPGSIPKVTTNVAFYCAAGPCATPFQDPEMSKFFPVRTLDAYVHKAAMWS